ncbi:MAG TPA: PhzF family phenazine biosynthesis protein [Parafilimonas sp.]|nr:PhzF family phenazine biosynthesis protein [Parafilimonas sp.]
MKLPIFIVDAFTNKLFGGNPAAVCPLHEWLPDKTMQSLAAENNLSETAFIIEEDDHYRIRWFTPSVEVSLCGHATLASAHIFYTELNHAKEEIWFESQSGMLKVSRKDETTYTLNFPANPPEAVSEIPDGLFKGLKISDAPVFKTTFDYMVVLPSQQVIENLKPDFLELSKVQSRGVVTTAKGRDSDFVSRCFYPQSGINEDPVTGSAHTILVPYWANKLGKNNLAAQQLSARKGYLDCELKNDRVLMSGNAVTYMKGEYII